MDPRNHPYSSYATHNGYQQANQPGALPPSIEEGPRKRRAIGMSPSRSSEDAGGYRNSMLRSSPREELAAAQEQARLMALPWETHLPMILKRLATVETELETLKSSSPIRQHPPDIASRRSILSLAMQGSSDTRSHQQLSSQNDTTPIYSDQERSLDGSSMSSLSLRRDLSSPEHPPFGMWWTFTIEETLVWPILDFKGCVNSGLDTLLDIPDEEDSDSEDELGSIPERSSLGRKTRAYIGRVKKGLDDGATVHELVGSFLKNVHTQNPVLDPSELQANAANLIENGLGWDGKSCQVLLACALGALSYSWTVSDLEDFSGPKTSPERYSLGREYFNAAQKRLGGLWSRSSLLSAQCLFMTGLYFMYTLQPVAGWRAFNSATIACRSCISKRVAQQGKAISRTNTRSLEQRLCWSCIKSEREIACEFGMETSGLNLLAYSTTLPTPPNGYASDISQLSTMEAANQAHPSQLSTTPGSYEDETWYYYLTEIMLRKLEMRIDIFFQDKRREAYRRAGESPELFFRSMVEALQEFGFQLTRYYEALPAVMHFSLEDLTPCSDEFRHFLRLRLFCVKHDITMPALYILLHNDVTRWSKDLVEELVQLANACLMLDIKILKMSITTYRHQTAWLCLRIGVRSALILIAAERLAAQHIPGLEGLYVPEVTIWEDGARALIKGLKYWSRESRDCLTYLDILQQLHPIFHDQESGT